MQLDLQARFLGCLSSKAIVDREAYLRCTDRVINSSVIVGFVRNHQSPTVVGLHYSYSACYLIIVNKVKDKRLNLI